MRLWHGTHKLLRIRTHNSNLRQFIIQHPPDHILSRLPFPIPNLLPGTRKRSLGRPVIDRPNNRLGSRFAFRRGIYPISIPRDDAKVELSLVLFRDWKAQYVLYDR
jgi:hypothetical protein